jgi:glycolate oxidase
MSFDSLIADKSRVFLGADIEEKYLSDGLGRKKGRAEALFFPVSTSEVSRILSFASARGVPVTPRGAGTNLVGSTVPADGGFVLDLSRMNRLLEIDVETLTATVEAGVVLGEFQKRVEEEGLFYPPDPGEKQSCLGGNIATNAGGMRAVKYGVTRDYVRGLELVRADGAVLRLGGKNAKDSTGLSLKNLIIGSEGLLGVITRCVLRLIPKPAYSFSALLAFPGLEESLFAARRLLLDGVTPVAVEFVEREVAALGEAYAGVKFPFPSARAYILVSYDGGAAGQSAEASRKAVELQAARLRDLAGELGAVGIEVISDPRRLADIWSVRGSLVKAVENFSEQEPLDMVVPINKIAGFIDYIHKLEKDSGVRMIAFGHAGDGNIHVCVLREKRGGEEWARDLDAVMTRVYLHACSLDGLISGEHGIGISKQPYFLRNTQPELLELMTGIKRVFDPRGILNPGKVFHLGGAEAGKNLTPGPG